MDGYYWLLLVITGYYWLLLVITGNRVEHLTDDLTSGDGNSAKYLTSYFWPSR